MNSERAAPPRPAPSPRHRPLAQTPSVAAAKMATAMYLEHYLDSKHLGRAARPRGSAPPPPLAHRDPCGTPGCGRGWGLVMGTSGGSRPFWGGVVDGGRGARRGVPPPPPRQFQVRHGGAEPEAQPALSASATPPDADHAPVPSPPVQFCLGEVRAFLT